MPIFKEFIKNAVNNYKARPFKVAKGIKMMVVDSRSGKKADFGSKKTIIESFKDEKFEKAENIGIDNKILLRKTAKGFLRDWIVKRKIVALIVRPDKYIFGSASSKKEVTLLLNCFSHMYRV